MEERSYSSLSRHSLASSSCQLDGVPFKIGQNFMPPAKIVEPLVLYRSNISKILNVEYTFETEEAVLAWAQAKEEAVRKAAEEEAKRLAEEQRKQEEAKAEELNSKSDVRADADEADITSKNEDSVYDVPKSSASSFQNHDNYKEKPRVPPKPLSGVNRQVSEPGTILKPMPIHLAANSIAAKRTEAIPDNKTAETDSRFDVSMFESEADPFDNLELQTLNDMEELKILLDSSSKSSTDNIAREASACLSQTSSDKDDVAAQHEECAAETIYDVAAPVKGNTWETFSDESPELDTNTDKNVANPRGKTPSPSIVHSDANGTSGQNREDDEYVEITNSYKTQSVNFHSHAVNGVTRSSSLGSWAEKTNTESVFGGKLPASLANSNLYKPLLPPFTKPEVVAHDNSNTNTNPFIQPSAQETTNPFLSQTTKDAQNLFVQNLPEHWSSFSNDSDVQADSILPGEQNSSTQQKAPSASTPPPVNPSLLPPPPPASRPPRNRQSNATARMWSSVGPSLAASFDETSSVNNHVQENPYSRHSLSSSDLSSSSSDRKSPILQKFLASQNSSQPWNRHRPLPPIPTPLPAATLLTPESYKVSLLPPSQQMGLTDPYYSLSREAQTFTDSLTSMGFLRARVARAVAKFGQDEKEVIDHLIAVDMLMDKKFAPVLAESALITFKNDVEKAEKFLQMLTQFEELGFSSDKIQEALVSTNMDYDKVLDILTT